MKTVILSILLAFLGLNIKAQNFQEIFNQKKTQKEYLINQIAALQIYIGFAQKSYQISKQGITLIGDITKGELNLHRSHYSALKTVNPAIKKLSRVSEILTLQQQIVKTYKSLSKFLDESNLIDQEEKNFGKRTFNLILEDCSSIIDDLYSLTTNGDLIMTDDERLSRLNSLYNNMLSNYEFSQTFYLQVMMVLSDKSNSLIDSDFLRSLYTIKN